MSEQIERGFLVQLVAKDGAVQDVAHDWLSFTSGISSSKLKGLIHAACAPLLNNVGLCEMRIRDHPDFLDQVTADSFPGHGREGQEPIVITVALQREITWSDILSAVRSGLQALRLFFSPASDSTPGQAISSPLPSSSLASSTSDSCTVSGGHFVRAARAPEGRQNREGSVTTPLLYNHT
ncbi:unnamed protein product [Vitrella brassicaformis CCMP3155]|uniref:Uncharacterized protein n=2 Tax=Vitrella brassicaformis TaxID=1169539 RepID=A0A0G4FZR7_VITBC|nr:unnamed protein product [Vitrella brassicaformis CCMP3155]|mmetsp:Transcript_24271/g.59917  ORF Transcript_24271/g.59917 Transcript_24271/m.59917 type:complete len:180 (+) Transcript_24271:214-753(+)|eukprot:CEM21132.1 unnamed protein product [Vitrella brassicaformis CCMP3155]